MSGWSQHKSHSTIEHEIKIPNYSKQNSISATVKFESAENQLELDSADSAVPEFTKCQSNLHPTLLEGEKANGKI